LVKKDGSVTLASVLDAARRQDSAHVPKHVFFQSTRWASLLHGCSLTMCVDGAFLEMDAKVKSYCEKAEQFCN
jgi:hypothetical protein